MTFQFELRPVEDIVPWRTKNAAPYLSWFGLTDGWFWIEIDGQELFRYSKAILDKWEQEHTDAPPQSPFPSPHLPYTDYYVVRYWEDLLDLLPTVLDPLPDDFAARVADEESQRQWCEWTERAWAWQDAQEDEAVWDTCYTATAWWEQHRWSAWHIQNPPQIWLWRVGDLIHIRWDNRDVKADNLPVWSAEQGEATLPFSTFSGAASSFHDRFLGEMSRRVNHARGVWSRPDVEVDLGQLEREQQERVGWLDSKIRLVERKFSWDEVRGAILEIEKALASDASTFTRGEQINQVRNPDS